VLRPPASRPETNVEKGSPGVRGGSKERAYNYNIGCTTKWIARDRPGRRRIPMEEGRIVSRDPEVMSGELVFAGTRVEVKTLVDYLRAGHTLDEFLEGFPSVSRERRAGSRRRRRRGR
jgi:uncharacterized protein (DUF433 family)